MILSDATVFKLIKKRAVVIDPVDISKISTVSVVLGIGCRYAVMRRPASKIRLNSALDASDIYDVKDGCDNRTLMLPQSRTVLLTTLERIELGPMVSAIIVITPDVAKLGFIAQPVLLGPGFRGRPTVAVRTPDYEAEVEPGTPFFEMIVMPVVERPGAPDSGGSEDGISLPRLPLRSSTAHDNYSGHVRFISAGDVGSASDTWK